MHLTSLDVRSVRNLQSVSIHPVPGINLFTGENGAGKTSLLEAVSLLSTGRSFRSGAISTIISAEAEELSVIGHIKNELTGSSCISGISRSRDALLAKIDGQTIARLSELASALPCLEITARNHELIEGGPTLRRSYIDWIVFHVEHQFGDNYRRYRHALSQRNAALKIPGSDAILDSWDRELEKSGTAIHEQRLTVVEAFGNHYEAVAANLPLDYEIDFSYSAGWNREYSFAKALQVARQNCQRLGTTSVGPHRADLRIRVKKQDVRYMNSRGQQKLLAIVMKLVQCEIYKQHHGHPPIVLFDDMSSELDDIAQEYVVSHLKKLGVQVFLTAISDMTVGKSLIDQRFHVEQGLIGKVI